MDPILITSCSSTRLVSPQVRVGEMPTGLNMSQALQWWMEALNSREAELTPRELYRGLGFTTLVKIQEQFKLTGVKIITGGQGLIDIDEKIVPYDFTASPKEPENIHQKVTGEPFVQTVWWKLINSKRGKGEFPIAKLVEEHPDTYVIISASKIFLRYASDDILMIPYRLRDKVRILLTASSIGSVPRQLRPMIIPFERSEVSHMPGNRNDTNHRAAQQFLDRLQDPTFYALDISKQQTIIESQESEEVIVTAHGAPVQLEAFLRERPNYLDLPLEQAYKLTQRTLGNVGGRVYFRSVVRQLKGSTVTTSSEDVQRGVEALKGLGIEFSKPEGSFAHEEESALKDLKTFVEVIRIVAPKAVFNAADVCRWAPSYYKGQEPPGIMMSPNKLSFILKNNAPVLGLIAVEKGFMLSIPQQLS